jgi:osmotically-inducible protein OsmY
MKRNDVELRGMDDARIARVAKRALECDARVPPGRVRASVEAGVLTLEGSVDFLTEREEADHAVRRLAGVRRVDNRIVVTPQEPLTNEVRRAVEGALARHAAREAGHLAMAVSDGTVRLTGRVGSPAERQLVIGAARGTHGVRAVEDQLIVAP